MPPNLRTAGAVPFGDPQRSRLGVWLRDTAWPRRHMDMAELEGYLVALLAWPVGISSGAWLPPIWGERGWKVPPNISSKPQFDEFVALIIGFMQKLDRDLSHLPSRFESSVLRALRGREQLEGFHRWGRGFMTALALGSQGLKGRSASDGAAVRTIASATSMSAPSCPRDVEVIVSAVLALMVQRTSRGPLGPLEAVVAPDSPVLPAERHHAGSARSRV